LFAGGREKHGSESAMHASGEQVDKKIATLSAVFLVVRKGGALVAERGSIVGQPKRVREQPASPELAVVFRGAGVIQTRRKDVQQSLIISNVFASSPISAEEENRLKWKQTTHSSQACRA
jgi:hypothetical protein